MKRKNTPQTLLRVPVELHSKIKELAKLESRTMVAELRLLVEKRLKELKDER